jgi:hypothetical protein
VDLGKPIIYVWLGLHLRENIRPRKPCAQWQQELRPLGLIIFTMHHQHRQRDVLQVAGKIRLREGDDAVVVRFRAPRKRTSVWP